MHVIKLFRYIILSIVISMVTAAELQVTLFTNQPNKTYVPQNETIIFICDSGQEITEKARVSLEINRTEVDFKYLNSKNASTFQVKIPTIGVQTVHCIITFPGDAHYSNELIIWVGKPPGNVGLEYAQFERTMLKITCSAEVGKPRQFQGQLLLKGVKNESAVSKILHDRNFSYLFSQITYDMQDKAEDFHGSMISCESENEFGKSILKRKILNVTYEPTDKHILINNDFNDVIEVTYNTNVSCSCTYGNPLPKVVKLIEESASSKIGNNQFFTSSSPNQLTTSNKSGKCKITCFIAIGSKILSKSVIVVITKTGEASFASLISVVVSIIIVLLIILLMILKRGRVFQRLQDLFYTIRKVKIAAKVWKEPRSFSLNDGKKEKSFDGCTKMKNQNSNDQILKVVPLKENMDSNMLETNECYLKKNVIFIEDLPRITA